MEQGDGCPSAYSRLAFTRTSSCSKDARTAFLHLVIVRREPSRFEPALGGLKLATELPIVERSEGASSPPDRNLERVQVPLSPSKCIHHSQQVVQLRVRHRSSSNHDAP